MKNENIINVSENNEVRNFCKNNYDTVMGAGTCVIVFMMIIMPFVVGYWSIDAAVALILCEAMLVMAVIFMVYATLVSNNNDAE